MNMLEKYIDFEKNSINQFAKEVLSDYYDEELFKKLDKAKADFQEYMGEFNFENTQSENKSPVDKINDQFKEYNTPSFMDPIKAYKLNREYHELTGEDHPKFLEETTSVIATLNRDRDALLRNGAYESRYFDALNNITEYVKLKNSIHFKDSRIQGAK